MQVTDPIFTDADEARKFLEAERWPDGPVCPHCGNAEQTAICALQGKKHRPGLYQCNACREQFTVTVGTVFERSKIPLNKWLLASYLMTSSKKGISAHQLYRSLGFGSYRTAWFMAHRLREAMRPNNPSPMGGDGATVEVDETFIGRIKGVPKHAAGWAHKNVVLTLVERGGEARSFHVDSTSIADIVPIVKANVAKETAMMTDTASQFRNTGNFASHDKVAHSRDEYVRYEGERVISTNSVENYYSVFKRGMKGVYQHCGEQHLHRYLAEFDFRYSNRAGLDVDDATRTAKLVRNAEGKRLMYQRPA